MTVSGGNIVMRSKHYRWHLDVCSAHMVTKVRKCFEGDLKEGGEYVLTYYVEKGQEPY